MWGRGGVRDGGEDRDTKAKPIMNRREADGDASGRACPEIGRMSNLITSKQSHHTSTGTRE